MRATYHPSYDPTEGVWFCDGLPDCRSLAEMQRVVLLGEIEGYHPGGTPAGLIVFPKEVVERAPFVMTAAKRNSAVFRPAQRRAPPLAPAAEPNQMHPPVSRDAIGTFLRKNTPTTIRSRIVKRVACRPRLYDHELILDLWASGLTSGQIAGRNGMPSAPAVCVIISDHRKLGDPRAAYMWRSTQLTELARLAPHFTVEQLAFIFKSETDIVAGVARRAKIEIGAGTCGS